jgi:hypothetical protein
VQHRFPRCVSPCVPLGERTRVRGFAHVVNSGTKLVGNQRVFLVTDNDEPAGSHTSQNQAQTTYNVSHN